MFRLFEQEACLIWDGTCGFSDWLWILSLIYEILKNDATSSWSMITWSSWTNLKWLGNRRKTPGLRWKKVCPKVDLQFYLAKDKVDMPWLKHASFSSCKYTDAFKLLLPYNFTTWPHRYSSCLPPFHAPKPWTQCSLWTLPFHINMQLCLIELTTALHNGHTLKPIQGKIDLKLLWNWWPMWPLHHLHHHGCLLNPSFFSATTHSLFKMLKELPFSINQ